MNIAKLAVIFLGCLLMLITSFLAGRYSVLLTQVNPLPVVELLVISVVTAMSLMIVIYRDAVKTRASVVIKH